MSFSATWRNFEFLPRLHRLDEWCSEINPELTTRARIAWKRIARASADPIVALVAAKKVRDHYLHAYAYYHILQKTNGRIAADTRLDTLDRLRLMTGSFNLRRYEIPLCNCSDRHEENTGYYVQTMAFAHIPTIDCKRRQTSISGHQMPQRRC